MLSEALKEIADRSKANLPEDVVKIMQENTELLAKSKLKDKAIKVGDVLPSFKMSNALGKEITSEELLSKGPLVINYYRGGW
tara:strand:- start:179 stop:424 length:246 start_codon:yes stop_codon:yes gene_type:complete